MGQESLGGQVTEALTKMRKPQGPRITAERYDAIIAALREAPDDIAGIAMRFDVNENMIRRLRPRLGR
jgi:hypothetical protein